MNKKAEIFQAYLEEKSITCFTVQELLEDQLNSVVFRSTIAVEGQELPTIIVCDDSIYTVIRCRVAAAALKEENETALIKAINQMNAQYKVFKYYFTEEGDLVLDSIVLSKPEELDPTMIYTILDVIVQHLIAEYKNIMKAIWA